MIFYVGLDRPADARHFERAFISVNTLRKRKGDFPANRWVLDSGAFTEISTHGHYRHGVEAYAEQIRRWAQCGTLDAAVAQDFMCEPFIIEKTGLSVAEHQRLTIERYDRLVGHGLPVPVMPVLQGFDPWDYRRHLEQYGDRLAHGAWVGVGSVCKRNARPMSVAMVLAMIKKDRPDLRLHGFGIKVTALKDAEIRSMLYSSDSMAWSFHARKQGRNAHDLDEARAFVARINALPHIGDPRRQLVLPI